MVVARKNVKRKVSWEKSSGSCVKQGSKKDDVGSSEPFNARKSCALCSRGDFVTEAGACQCRGRDGGVRDGENEQQQVPDREASDRSPGRIRNGCAQVGEVVFAMLCYTWGIKRHGIKSALGDVITLLTRGACSMARRCRRREVTGLLMMLSTMRCNEKS